jgi:hypothetical protein
MSVYEYDNYNTSWIYFGNDRHLIKRETEWTKYARVEELINLSTKKFA